MSNRSKLTLNLPIKIAFVGAHGTGKTTLVNALEEHFNSRGIQSHTTPEVPRIICDSLGDPEFFRRENNTFLKQLLLLIGQPIYEGATSSAADSSITLCDRSIIDHWAYTINLFSEQVAQNEHILIPISNFIERHCRSYSHLFYVPIEFAPEDDGVREEDAEFQAKIDKEIINLLQQFDIPYHSVSGSVPQRVDKVVNTLS